MKILHFADHTLRYNGMAHAAVDLACAQAQLGHSVALCCGDSGFDDLLRAHGVERLRIAQPGGPSTWPAAFMDIARAVRSVRPDVIHGHMVRSTVLAWPTAKLLGVPLVTCVQNSFSKNAICMGLGERVITGCQAVAADMARRGIPKRKLRPVLNGTIGSPRYSQPPPRPVALQRPAVITVCGLHPRKGVHDLIRGFETARRDLPELHLYIVGEGPSEQAFRDQVGPEHRDHVHFVTATPDPRPYMLGADLFVLASLADPAPLVLAEAREAGLPVVATQVDGIPELLEFGKAGALIPPGAPDRLGAKLVELFSAPERLAQLRRDGQLNLDRLTLERVARETVAVYQELTIPKRRVKSGGARPSPAVGAGQPAK